MAENDHVQDDEELYRNVRSDPKYNHYSYETGGFAIEPDAFWDGDKRPSVDRASLLDCYPHRALLDDTNAIVSIMAGDVRTRTIEDINKVNDSVPHAVDVVFCPECDRPAHSLIIMNPERFESNNKQKNAFRYLQKALARLANEFIVEHGWTLPLPK